MPPARKIRGIAPNSRILFVSENRCPEVVQEALATGANGYVVKSNAAFDLLPAMRAIVSDRQFIGGRFADFTFIGGFKE